MVLKYGEDSYMLLHIILFSTVTLQHGKNMFLSTHTYIPGKVNTFFIFQYHGQIAEDYMCGNFIFFAKQKIE